MSLSTSLALSTNSSISSVIKLLSSAPPLPPASPRLYPPPACFQLLARGNIPHACTHLLQDLSTDLSTCSGNASKRLKCPLEKSVRITLPILVFRVGGGVNASLMHIPCLPNYIQPYGETDRQLEHHNFLTDRE